MKQRSEILTWFLVLLFIFNSVTAIKWSANWLVFQNVQIQEFDAKDLKEQKITKDEIDSAIYEAKVYSLLIAIFRIAAAMSVAFLFLYKKLALWFYILATIGVLLTDFWEGSSASELVIILLPPIILVVLLKCLQPIAWTQFN